MPMPATFNDWPEGEGVNKLLFESLARVRSYKEDSKVTLAKQAKSIKAEISHIDSRIKELVNNPSSSDIHDVSVLSEDLNQALRRINGSCDAGAEWTAEAFGCSRDDFTKWRSQVAKLKNAKEFEDKQSKKHVELRQEINIKNMGTKKWPRITRSSWLAFLKIWIVEHTTLGDEWIKFQTLKGLLDDPEDVESAKHMKNSEELINSLKVKYGGLVELTPGAKLKDLKRPATA